MRIVENGHESREIKKLLNLKKKHEYKKSLLLSNDIK